MSATRKAFLCRERLFRAARLSLGLGGPLSVIVQFSTLGERKCLESGFEGKPGPAGSVRRLLPVTRRS